MLSVTFLGQPYKMDGFAMQNVERLTDRLRHPAIIFFFEMRNYSDAVCHEELDKRNPRFPLRQRQLM